MGKLILVTGGSRSGKSTYAENLAKSFEDEVLYIATCVPFDDEMKDRVRKHRESRPKSWETYEDYRNLKQVYSREEISFKCILLDCITVMIANLIFDLIGENVEELTSEEINAMEKSILNEIKEFIDTADINTQTVILVTNEVGSGIIPDNKLSRIYKDIAGRINQYIALRTDEVYLTVCGIPIKIK
ncbi:bifunctional adenosylcobinamide kinase/adenosylcobinamide-phosphate guanylyltransferase [Clostridium sp.]|uniref:bifunctional adenosylcobinamide kinase/adenosylcobinamide-phosphate guanylyltransferase n=1 Tax=Clostridium sp. TaxID=1506 RepID=UPI003D6D93B1